jgi:outer membrane protein TolC
MRRKGRTITERNCFSIFVSIGTGRIFIVTVIVFCVAMAANAQERRPSHLNPVAPVDNATLGQVVADSPAPAAGRPLLLTLQDAQARAVVASKASELARLNVTAARYHRQAAQADYFPKIGSTFANLHFNKFMGQEITVLNRSRGVPLIDKDQSLFAVTVTQPVTPLLQVRQLVRIARADERIAQAKAEAATAAIQSSVQNAYFALLIAQRQKVVAETKVKTMDRQIRLASMAAPTLTGSLAQRDVGLAEAAKALLTASSRVADLSSSLNALIGTPMETPLELAAPLPLEEVDLNGRALAPDIERNPEVVEARESVEKARAATSLAKFNYMPEVAGFWGYSFQNGIPLLPRDFSFVGFMASWNVFDFGRRENTIGERTTQLRMAKANLELVRAKVAAGAKKASLDMQRTRRILQLTRKVASLYQAAPAAFLDGDLEAQAARAQAEAEMFQADLDFRLAYADLQRMVNDR